MEPDSEHPSPSDTSGDWCEWREFEQLLVDLVAVVTAARPEVRYEFFSDLGAPAAPDSPTQLETIDHLSNRSGPIIYAPSWERRSGQSIDASGLLTLRPIDEQDCVVALLPAGVLTLRRDRRLRAALNERWHVSMVLSLRDVLPGVHPSFVIAALFLTPPGADEVTRFVNPNADASIGEIRDDALRLARMKGGRKQHGFVTRAVLDLETWNPHAYDPRLADEAQELEWFGATVALGELVEILIPSGSADRSYESMPTTRIISARDIGRDGSLLVAVPSPRPTRQEKPTAQGNARGRPLLQLRSGDLVVHSSMVHPSDARAIFAAVVSPADLPCYASYSVTVLRPKTILSETESRFLLAYLESKAASRQLRRHQTSALSIDALRQLPVPVLDEDLRLSFEDLVRGQRELRDWADEADDLLTGLFDKRTPREARTALLAGGRLLRQRAEAGRMLSDLGHIIRSRYPYPIAFRWRDVEVARSGDDLYRTVTSLTACYEITLCYVAQLCLAAARFHKVAMPPLETLSQKLNSGRSGPTLGDWQAILTQAHSRQFRKLPEGGELLEVRQFMSTGEQVQEAGAALIKQRDDDAHLRTLTPLQLKSAADSLYDHLLLVLDSAAFLVDIPLVRIEDVTWDSLGESGIARIQRLAGDHASVPFTDITIDNPELERGSLYAQSTTGQLHLLRPFLIGAECTTCHRWSTFHPDGYSGATVHLKSLEDGHVVEGQGMSAALRAVGLLPAQA